MKKINHKKIREILTGKNQITVKEINNLVWGNKWNGDVDPDALRERLEELLEIEEAFKLLTKQVSIVRKFFEQNSGD